MATQWRMEDGERYLYVKGAPEIVLGMSKSLAPGLDREAVLARLKDWWAR